MSQLPDFRAQRGETIAKIVGAVRRLDADSYVVKSQSGNGEYSVLLLESGWNCSSRDFEFRGVKCKHIFGVEYSLGMGEIVVNG